MPLAVVDNEDGTVTYTLSGGSPFVPCEIFRGRFEGAIGPVAFESVGSLFPNASKTETLTPGMYVAYPNWLGVEPPEVRYFSCTDGTLAVATRVRDSIAERFALTGLPCVAAGRIHKQIFPDPSNMEFPCTLLTTEDVSEEFQPGLNELDYIGRPCRVQIADRVSEYQHDDLPDYEYWREKLMRAVLHQQLPGVTECIQCEITPYIIADRNLPQYQYFVSGFVVRALCREPRGIGS